MRAKQEEQANRNRLQALAEIYLAEPQNFRRGDLVDFYPGLQGTVIKGPMVVLGYLEEPATLLPDKPGSTYSGEKLDIRCGYLDADGDLVTANLNSRRLRPLPDPEA